MLEKKSIRVLLHLASLILMFILLVSLMNIRAISDPPGLMFLLFLLIPLVGFYFLFDREDSDGRLSNILFFVLIGISAFVLLIAAAAGGSTYLGYDDGPISLIQYAALSSTPIALVVAVFAFVLIHNHMSDAEFLYPFIPVASCILGFLLGIPICAIGYAAPFMLVWGGFVFFLLAAALFVIYIKLTDLPMSGYYKELSLPSFLRPKKRYTPAPAAPKPASTPAPTPKPAPAPAATASTSAPKKDTSRADFIRSLTTYRRYMKNSCCREMVRFEATVDTVVRGDEIVVTIRNYEVNTYELEQNIRDGDYSEYQAQAFVKECKERQKSFIRDVNSQANKFFDQLAPLVDRFNDQNPEDGFDLVCESIE